MTVIGFSYKKILVEKKEKPLTGSIQVKNNVAIKEIMKDEVNMPGPQGVIKFVFNFVSSYEPELAKIELEGELRYMRSEEEVSKILDKWTSEKKIDDPELMTKILNAIMNRCNVQAIILSRDMNLPPPVQLPKFKAKVGDEETSSE